MSRTQAVRRWRSTDLEQIGWVHSLSRQDAYARLVPAEALARVTPEQQAGVWRTRFAQLPETHAAFVVEHNRAVQMLRVRGCSARFERRSRAKPLQT